uniref:Uncharacterized protein n=1 Tax=Arundo donax TaxID=35708 RepID=A0A0A9AEL8_ARUDO
MQTDIYFQKRKEKYKTMKHMVKIRAFFYDLHYKDIHNYT